MKYQISPGVHLALVGGEGLVLNSKNEHCYQLNSVAVRFWAGLAEGLDFEDCLSKMLNEFEVEEDVLRTDLSATLKKLIELKLLCALPNSSA